MGGLIWKFRPGDPPIVSHHPEVVLGSELASWFVRAKVQAVTNADFRIELELQKSYFQDKNWDERLIHLAYHLMGESSVLSQGVIPCRIQPTGMMTVDIPNPTRVSPRSIQLSLAH